MSVNLVKTNGRFYTCCNSLPYRIDFYELQSIHMIVGGLQLKFDLKRLLFEKGYFSPVKFLRQFVCPVHKNLICVFRCVDAEHKTRAKHHVGAVHKTTAPFIYQYYHTFWLANKSNSVLGCVFEALRHMQLKYCG